MRRLALAFVGALAFLIFLAEVQRLDDTTLDQIEQLRGQRANQ